VPARQIPVLDGHTYHVESDVAKQYVTFMFGEEEEEPITNEMQISQKISQQIPQRISPIQ
jgi:hypothetical protein